MTTGETRYVHYAECCESLRRAWRILQNLRGSGQRTAIQDAAFRFALVEYGKLYRGSDSSRPRSKGEYILEPPNLEPDDLALHRKILALRDQALAHAELTLKDAEESRGRYGDWAAAALSDEEAAPLAGVDALIGLIERSLDKMYVERERLLAGLGVSRARRILLKKSVKIAVRAIGTLLGLFGVAMLYLMGSVWLDSLSFQNHHVTIAGAPWILFGLFTLVITVYFIYVGYLVWFRFSPLAVRHICGTLAFFLLGQPVKWLDAHHPPLLLAERSPWFLFGCLAFFVAIYVAYRSASGRLSRFLFPETPAS